MIKTYEGFLNLHLDQRLICRKYGIKKYTINKDGSINVDDDVIITFQKLTSLPLKFNKVTDEFWCQYNQLTSLEGSPIEVASDFICNNNQLTSLEGSPKKIGGSFDCTHNKIWTFEGAPEYVNGNFLCFNNPIWCIWALFEDYSKIELFNYYDIIREVDGEPAIVLDRLNDFLEEIGRDPVKKVYGYIAI